MRKAVQEISYILCLLLFAGVAAAQFTQVSGTVVDPNGLPYANGTITPILKSASTPTITATGFPYTPPTQATGLDASGSFLMQLANQASLSPGGTTWTFHTCSGTGTILPSGGKGPLCFDVTGVVIAGATQSLTATLQAAAPALGFTTVGTGNVSGPANSTLNDVVVFGDLTGKTLADVGFGFPLANTHLANSSVTVNGQAIALGATANVNAGAAAHSTALNQGNGAAITGVGPCATNTVLLGATAADPSCGPIPNATLANSTVTLNGTANQLTSPGATALGGTATFALTSPVKPPGDVELLDNTHVFSWDCAGVPCLGLSLDAGGAVDVGNGTPGNTTGSMNLASTTYTGVKPLTIDFGPGDLSVATPTAGHVFQTNFAGSGMAGFNQTASGWVGLPFIHEASCAGQDNLLCSASVDGSGNLNYLTAAGNVLTIAGTATNAVFYVAGLRQKLIADTTVTAANAGGSPQTQYLILVQDTATPLALVGADFLLTSCAPLFQPTVPASCAAASISNPQLWYNTAGNRMTACTGTCGTPSNFLPVRDLPLASMTVANASGNISSIVPFGPRTNPQQFALTANTVNVNKGTGAVAQYSLSGPAGTTIPVVSTSSCGLLDNVICSSAVDASGNPSYISQGTLGSRLTINGAGLVYFIGGVQQVGTGTYTDAITGLGSSTFNYVYALADSTNPNVVAADFASTTLAPVYSYKSPTACTGASGSAPQYWFDLSTNQWKKSTAAACSFSVASPQVIFLGVVWVTVTPTISGVGHEPFRLNPYDRFRNFGDGFDAQTGQGGTDIVKQEKTTGTTVLDNAHSYTSFEMTGATVTPSALNNNGTVQGVLIVYSQNPVIIVNTSSLNANALGRVGGTAATSTCNGASGTGFGGAGGGGGGASATNAGCAGGARMMFEAFSSVGGGGAGGIGGAGSNGSSTPTNPPFLGSYLGIVGNGGGSGGGDGGAASGGAGATGGGAIVIRAPSVIEDASSTISANAGTAGAGGGTNGGGGGGGGGGFVVIHAGFFTISGTETASLSNGGLKAGGGGGGNGGNGTAGVVQNWKLF